MQRAPVRTVFGEENTFNAYARRGDDASVIELARSVPLLMLILLEKLLSDARLFSYLEAAGQRQRHTPSASSSTLSILPDARLGTSD